MTSITKWRNSMTGFQRFFLLVVAAFLSSVPAFAQEKWTEHTLKLSPGQKPVQAMIKEMAWYAGNWIGDGFGGQSEEIWSPPKDGAMMGMYRHLKNGKPVFYELITMLEENGTLVMHLKHFNA